MLRPRLETFIEKSIYSFDICLWSDNKLQNDSMPKAEDVGSTIEKIRIGHDNAGFGSAWHLEKVEVRRLKEEVRTRILIHLSFYQLESQQE